MRNKIPVLAAAVIVGALLSGCANTERKLGRGISNTTEIVRLGEFRRTVEQTALFEGADAGYSYGVVHGLSRSLGRTGIGIYETITAPFPPYDPVATDIFAPGPVYPDSYTPNLLEDPLFATDANLGFSGGDVLPVAPGSRFRIFDTH